MTTTPSPGPTNGDSIVPNRKRLETWVFIFLTVLLAPALSVAFVGGYGFLIWMSQLILGPPSA